MNATQFAVKHKTTGLFFGGFAADKSPLWVAESAAYGMDLESAKGQAQLFARFGIPAQKKPVAL